MLSRLEEIVKHEIVGRRISCGAENTPAGQASTLIKFANGAKITLKTGKSLQELAAEVERQAQAKHDYLVGTKDLKMMAWSKGPQLEEQVKLEMGGKSGELLTVGRTAHDQIANETQIPIAYYQRMLAEKPDLLAHNVNEWFQAKPKVRMLRTLDGRARALLSDRYRPLDNHDLLEAALPAMSSAKLKIVSCEVTESRLYVKAVDEAIQRHIPNGFRMGDGSHQGFKVPSGEVIPAVQFSNSEIGLGALNIVGGYLDSGCTNLMWSFRERGLKKTHLGARLEVGDELYRLLTAETKQATDKAVWLQFRDAIKAAISVEGFHDLVQRLHEAASDQIKGDPMKVVEVTAKKLGLSEERRVSVLQHLIRGGDLSKFGLANAVTSVANEVENYDDATDLERLGGQIIELPKSEWTEIAKAA